MHRADPTKFLFVAALCLTCNEMLWGAGENNPLGILPTPQQSRTIEAVFELSGQTPIILTGRSGPREEMTARILQYRLHQITGLLLPIERGTSRRGIRLLTTDSPEGTVALSKHRQSMPFGAGKTIRGWQSDYQMQQEYYLHVSAAEATVVANSNQGLLHGAMTLAQLARPEDMIVGAEIRDWPEMRIRGLHLRLDAPLENRSTRPTCGQIKRLIEVMARFKLNCLLLEPRGGVELPSLRLASPGEVLTVAQQQEIRRFASAFGIEVIPVLDSWADAEHWQRHAQTRDCLQNGRIDLTRPETLDILTRMATDLDRNLNNSSFLHLGGRGVYPDAQDYARFHASLMQSVRQKTGKKAILWAMSCGTPPSILAQWPADAILIPDHPQNPHGGCQILDEYVTDIWSCGLAAGKSQIAAVRPPWQFDFEPSVFADWSRQERDLSTWAEALYRQDRQDGSLGLVTSVCPPTAVEMIEAWLPRLCWAADLAWNDARAGTLPDDQFDRAVGWQLCGVTNGGERVLRICRELGNGTGSMSSAGTLGTESLADLINQLKQIQFSPAERPIHSAVTLAAHQLYNNAIPDSINRISATPKPAVTSLLSIPVAETDGAKAGLVGKEVSFSAAVSKDSSGSRSIRATWDFGDGTRIQGTKAQHIYAAPGMYLAGLTVTDQHGYSGYEPVLVTVLAKPEGVADGWEAQKASLSDVP